MAREIRGISNTGTLYARIMNGAGLWWNGSAFEVYSSAHYATYAVAMTEQGGSDLYVADFPAGITTTGTFEYFVYVQAGGSPAEGDQISGTGSIDWVGSSSITAASGAMSGSDFRDYILRRGFKRTDKDTEIYEATTDAIQDMRRRFMFDEAQVEATTTDTISVLGDFKIDVEPDMGLLLGVVLQDGQNATLLERISKSQYDALYPYAANDPSYRGYPRHFCMFAGSIQIGPTPDQTSYTYRLAYSRRAGTITSSTAGVPFTNLYRDILAALVLANLYDSLDEPEKAGYYRNQYENGLTQAIRRENKNASLGTFNINCMDV